MLLGVISDTHDRLENIDKAFAFFDAQQVAHVIHCGDFKSLETLSYILTVTKKYSLPFTGVLGNNDIPASEFMDLSESEDIHEGIVQRTIAGKSIAIYHGHHAPTLRKVRENKDYDIAFLGHTHKPKVEEEPGRLIVNPGSTAFSIPRSKLWLPTIAIIDTEKMTAKIIQLN